MVQKGYGAKAELSEDGYFGSSTEQAVRTFQRDNGLKIDGVVGVQTFGSLQVLGGADG
jgi:peptidoglycan hydrolase-like protein with peptidoglycan-binding domain